MFFKISIVTPLSTFLENYRVVEETFFKLKQKKFISFLMFNMSRYFENCILPWRCDREGDTTLLFLRFLFL